MPTTSYAARRLTRRALLELKAHVDDRITGRNDRIVSEVKVLESLVQRLATSIADRASEVEPDEIEDEEEIDDYPSNVVAGPTGPDDEEMLETIRRSLEDNRVDLYLQPVVSLPQRAFASTKRCHGCAPKTARSSCRRNTSASPSLRA